MKKFFKNIWDQTKSWTPVTLVIAAVLVVGFLVATLNQEARIGYSNLWYAVTAMTMIALWLRVRDKLIKRDFGKTYDKIRTNPMAAAVYHSAWVLAAAYIVGSAFLGN